MNVTTRPPFTSRAVSTCCCTKLIFVPRSMIGMPLSFGAKLQPEVEAEQPLLNGDEGHCP